MGQKNIEAMRETPLELGFRMPAEWETHQATWIAWPHNRTDWPGKLATIQWVYGEIVKKIISGEAVRILVNSEAHENRARRVLTSVGLDLSRVNFFRFQTNRSWTRDFGPIFIRRKVSQPELAIVSFRFNAWARYSDWRKDDAVSKRIAKKLRLPLFNATWNRHDVVLEGGSIDVNGCGTILTTEECLLDKTTQVRNLGLGKKDIEEVLCNYIGVKNVLWLGRGIAGDDTHGHIDDVCRFVGSHTVVLCREENSQDINYRSLEENRERLEGMQLEDGSNIEIISLPMPEPLYFNSIRLPASYANFYISNAAVIVPTFNDPKDRVALSILAEIFSDRLVIGIHAVELVWGLGTLHCLTREEPART